MQTKQQISLTRKTLNGVMLLGLFFSAFGAGNLPSARAQEAMTNVGLSALTSGTTYTIDDRTFVRATIDDAVTLDPALAYDTNSGEVIQNIYETLVFYDGAKASAFVPQLADSYSLSADGLTWTFHIRPGVTFHNGASLTPADVAYSFQRGLLQGGTSSPQWLLYEPFFGIGIDDISLLVDPDGSLYNNRAALSAWNPVELVAACQQVQTAVVADNVAGTVTMHLAQPWSPFLATIAGTWGSIMDKDWTIAQGGWDGSCATWQNWYAMNASTDTLTAVANGTGPFKLDHWTLGEEIVLARNNSYWREPAQLENVVIQTVPDNGIRFAMLQTGNADEVDVSGGYHTLADGMVGEDCTWNIATAQYDCSLVDAAKPLRRYIGRPGLSQDEVLLNFNIAADDNPYIGSGQLDGNGIPPDFFADVHIRKAFNYCFNWATYIQQGFGGEFIQATTLALEGMPGYDLSAPHYTFNLSKCQEEFGLADVDHDGISSSGDTNDVTQVGFHVQMLYNQGNTSRQIVAEILDANLAQINPKFVVEVVGLPWTTYLAAQNAHRIPIMTAGWQEDIHDPHNWYMPYLVGAFSNRAGIPYAMKAQFSVLLDQGIATSGFAARHAIYQQLNQLIYDNATFIMLGGGTSHNFIQRRVNGRILNPIFPGNYYYTITVKSLVNSITRASASPTSATNLDFTVMFSEPVTGVDAADFKLTTTTLMGATVTGVTGTGAGPYTVMVNTGTGNGTIRLDVRNTASIQGLVNAIVGPYSGGETYTVNKGTAPTVPVLKSPANNALVADYLPTLDWNDSSQVIALANDWSYEINVTAPLGVYDQTFNTPSGLSNSSYTFTTPLPANTTFTWKVRAYNDANQYSAWSATRTFRTKPPSTQLAAPTLISPNGALDNKRPTFEWTDVPGTTTYTLQILDGVKVINTGTIKAPLHTYTPATDLLPSKTYQWKVKANGLVSSDYSTPFTFTTSAANPPTIPVLTLPASNALVDGTAVQTLKWNPVAATAANPAAASYEVEYAANSAFTGSTSATVAVTQQPIAIGALSPNLTYYWHVRSVSAAGNHSAWSVARTFRTMLSTPVLNLPVDGAVLDNKRPTFAWDEVPGATTYTLQILIGTKIVNTGTIKVPAYVYTPTADLLPSTTYTWKVKANGTNAGNFSAPFAFITSGNPPKMPVLSAPASNALVDSAVAQILKWNPVLAVTTTSPATTYPAALSYEVEYAMNSSFTGASDTLATVDAPVAQTLPISLSPGRTYYWRVRAWSGTGASGSHSAWSLVRTIKVKFVAPTLGANPSGSGDLTFTWTSANGLWTNYTLTIINAATNKVVKSFTVPAPTMTYTVPAALLPAGTYRWQVKINGLYTPISSAISTDTFSK